MCRKKDRTKNGGHTHNNGNGKESRKLSDQDRQKPAGFGKGYTKENPRGKKEKEKKHPNPRSFQENTSKKSSEFWRRHYHPPKYLPPTETFEKTPDFP
ncbi:MAG: hypothetical protein HZC04_00015 [Candidatus Lloydbacteria bacterium]|nr:hypothetical protein [Candidatus Lloydbacteria bacterium]